MLSFLSMQSITGALKCSLLIPRSCVRVSAAFICSKELRDPDYKKPKPWPYETKKYTFFHSLYERTTKRFDENTKIIIVDGNICSGKTTLAKEIADAFDMKYIPEPDVEDHYVTQYGCDLRELDPLMPWWYKSCDLAKFYEDPHGRNCTLFQFRMYVRRYIQYIDALAHILNTGQGIVMDRCVFSDRVFLEAMHTCGYVKKNARDYYADIYNNCMEELMRPHLIIYLDISSETILKRIQERNNPIEVNSKVLNKKYLDCLEYEYKQNYLPKMEKHAELIVYDWTNYGDPEVVIEDIERVNFNKFERYDDKMKDWRREDEWDWNCYRRNFTNDKVGLLKHTQYFCPEIPELCPPVEDYLIYRDLLMKVPGERYCEGFNPKMGDKVLFKANGGNYRWFPYVRFLL